MAGRRKKSTDDDVVKESNVIARAKLSPPANSVWEERIISQVVAFNRADEKEFPERSFMIGQVVNAKKITGAQIREIETASRRLAETTFTVYYSQEKFRVFPVFEYIDYDHGIISAKLNQGLKPHYLSLKNQFAIRSLPEFRTLSSVHSQQMFRILNSWAGLPEAVIPVVELHNSTNAPESLRKDFRNFRVRVLEVAHREINEKTSLKFDWEPIKQGRKVTAVRFIFKIKT